MISAAFTVVTILIFEIEVLKMLMVLCTSFIHVNIIPIRQKIQLISICDLSWPGSNPDRS